MAKLQLYMAMAKSREGYKSLVNFNPAEDVRRHVGDFRSALDDIDYDADSINVFYLVVYREGGVLVTLLRTLLGRHGDHLAASVFIPGDIEIGDDEILDVLDSLREKICQTTMDNADIAALRNLFATDYPQAGESVAILESEGRDFACVRLGGGNPAFEDYVRNEFYLPAFAAYAGVLMVEDDDDVRIKSEVKDITPASVPALVTLAPPEPTGEGFAPYIYGKPFDHAYLVPLGEPLKIEWRHGGFKSIGQTIVPDRENFPVVAPGTDESSKMLSRSSFYITAQRSGEAIEDCEITVNGCPLAKPVPFTWDELSHAEVSVSAKGFFTYSGHMDLTSTTQALIQLKELRKVYRFDLPLNTPEPVDSAHFTIQCKRALVDCPVEGYTVAGDGLKEGSTYTNNLIYNGTGGKFPLWKTLAVGAGCLLVGFLAGWLCSGSSETSEEIQVTVSEEEPEEVPVPTVTATAVIPPSQATVAPQETPAEPAPEQAPAVDTPENPAPAAQTQPAQTPADYSAAVAYLDANKKWNRERMEAIPGLAGLFDAINTYNFDELRTVWAPRLRESSRFADLMRSVEGSRSKRDPRTGAHNPTYLRPGDNEFSVFGYRCWIDP